MKVRPSLRLLTYIFLFLTPLVFSTAAQAREEPDTTLADYLQRLNWARQTLQSPPTAQDWPATIKNISRAFPDQEVVVFPDSQKRKLTLPLKARWQKEVIPPHPKLVAKEREESLLMLSFYIRELELGGRVKTPAPQERQKLKEQLDGILHSPEFSGYRENLWLQKLKEWLSEWLSKILKPLGLKDTKLLNYFAYGLLALLIALILYFILKSLKPLFARQAAGEKQLKPEAPPEEEFRTEDWWARARALSQEGDFRGATRACFLGLLQFLEQERCLRYNRSKTNWEYLAELSSQAKLSVPMREITLSFDFIWYGQQPPDPEGYRQFHQQCQEVKDSLKGAK